MKHRYLSILLALIIMFTTNPAAVYAAAESASVDPAAAVLDELGSVETETFGLPADVGAEGEEELEEAPETDNVYAADSLESFAGFVKECLLRRETPFAVTIDYEVPLEGSEDQAALQALYNEKFALVNEETSKAVHDLAIAHTGVPKEGDYINGQIAWKRFINSDPVIENNILSIHFIYTYAVDYYASAEEEAKVDEEIARILSDGTLDLEGLTDYAKVKAIHDFICGTITYDDVHVGDTSYAHQYTPYAALFDHTAVCQGYALLFYRLCLEAGIDTRFIAGTVKDDEGNDEPHAWNIVKLGDLYYYVDTTWDDQETEEDPQAISYEYFLKGTDSSFTERTLDADYAGEEFWEKYPMAESDYVPSGLDIPPTFESISLLLGGQIGVNFFVNLPALEGVDYTKSRMDFTVGDSEEVVCSDTFDPRDMNAAGTYYKFTCPVSSIQMADTIHAKFYYDVNGEEYFTEADYSAQKYIESYMDSVDEANDPAPDETALVKALADYGYYAQQYLSSLRGWTLDTDHVSMAAPSVTGFDRDKVAEAVGESAAKVEYSDEITEFSSSLLLDSNTTLAVYVTPAEGYDGSVSISVGETLVDEPDKLPDGRYRIYITDIGATKLKEYTFTVTVKTDNGTAAATVDVYSYLSALLKKYPDDEKVLNLVGSLVNYADAAETYNRPAA